MFHCIYNWHNTTDIIAKIFKNDKPVARDNIATFEISNEYLQTFNFLYLVDSSLYEMLFLQIIFLNESYIIQIYK